MDVEAPSNHGGPPQNNPWSLTPLLQPLQNAIPFTHGGKQGTLGGPCANSPSVFSNGFSTGS